jgi:hypothetical protein
MLRFSSVKFESVPRFSSRGKIFFFVFAANPPRMPAALLALLATGIGFVLGLLLLRVLGEKAWHHAIALSVGVFFAVYIGLLLQSAHVAATGTATVTALTLLFWYAGLWPALASCVFAAASCAALAPFLARPLPPRPP